MTSCSNSRVANGMPIALQFAGFAIGSSVVLALIGPFGTALTMELPARLAHWMLSGGAIGLLTFGGVMAVSRFWRRGVAPAWIAMVVAAAAAAPGASIIEACLRLWSPSVLTHVRWWQLFGQCLFLNEVLTLLGMALLRQGSSPRDHVAVNTGAPTREASIAERLPTSLQSARIFILSAEDHYLRVHTDQGQALIHMRISDADALLRGADGLRVHRSHWVSRAAVKSARAEGGRWRLELKNGMSVPVGRSRVATLAEAGWLRKRGGDQPSDRPSRVGRS